MTKKARKKQTKKSKNEYVIENGNWYKQSIKVLENVYTFYFRPNESKIFWFIARKTWAWGKNSEYIPNKLFQNKLKIGKTKVSNTLKTLKDRQIITQLGNKIYAIQMNTDKWRDNPKKNKKVTQLGNKTTQNKTKTGTQIIKRAKDKISEVTQLGNKNLTKANIKANPQTPIDTLLIDNKDHHQNIGNIKPNDDSLFFLLKPKTLATLKKQPFGLGEPKIIRSIKITKRKDIDTHFSNCIDYILSRPDIDKPGRYFITMIKEGDEVPAPLYLARRVELVNDFTGSEVRAEKSTKFENMIEKQVIEKAKERIKEIPVIYNFKNQIERAKNPETKVRYQEREEQERQKAKAKLIHHICSLIKPSRLKMFRKKLVKLDPGNPNFKQAIARGYKLHTKRPYSDGFDEKVA